MSEARPTKEIQLTTSLIRALRQTFGAEWESLLTQSGSYVDTDGDWGLKANFWDTEELTAFFLIYEPKRFSPGVTVKEVDISNFMSSVST